MSSGVDPQARLHPPPFDDACRQVGPDDAPHLHLPIGEGFGMVHDHARPWVEIAPVLVVGRSAEAAHEEASSLFEEKAAELAADVEGLDAALAARQQRARDRPNPSETMPDLEAAQ